ncbi:MAG: hypothetical protein Q8K26_01455 [Candidatus Gracilibacteria bacterium]|nr:hypothetical protein [Candidatus Gracilibacteria bacterium]
MKPQKYILSTLATMTIVSGIVYALSYPTSVPTGETPGGKFKTYFTNMFTTGCTGTNVVQSIGSDGRLHCVDGGGIIDGGKLLYFGGKAGIFLKDGVWPEINTDGYETGSPGWAISYGQVKIENGVIYTRAHAGVSSSHMGCDSGWIASFSASCTATDGSMYYYSKVSTSYSGYEVSGPANGLRKANW